MVDTNTGYRMEVVVPLAQIGVVVGPDAEFGLDIYIIDDDDGGIRDNKLAWNSIIDEGWQMPGVFGLGRLLATLTPTPTDTATPTGTPTDTPTITPTPTPSDMPTPTTTPTQTRNGQQEITPTTTTTPTFTPTPTNTSTVTPTPTTTSVVGQVSTRIAMLPYLSRARVPTVPPSPQWAYVGDGPQTTESLAIHETTLFATDRRGAADGGGIYRRVINNCPLGRAFSRHPSVNISAFGIEFAGDIGLVAAFANGLYYSQDGGAQWTTASGIQGEVYSVAFAGNTSYAGAGKSVFESNDGGANWRELANINASINVIRRIGSSLWLGTEKEGVQELTLGSNNVTIRNAGLDDEDSRKIWDFLNLKQDTYYIATFNGCLYWARLCPLAAHGRQPCWDRDANVSRCGRHPLCRHPTRQRQRRRCLPNRAL